MSEEQLVPKLRFNGFDNEWEKTKLKNICKVQDGTHSTPNYTDEGIPFFSVDTIINNVPPKFISLEDHKKMIKRCHPQKGDILLSRITGGILGFSKLVDWDYDFSIYVSLALLSKIQIDSKYLNYYIQSPVYRNDFLSKSLLIASPPKINLSDLESTLINYPNSNEQEKIANFLDLVDKKIELLENKLQAYQGFKKYLMQQIFAQKLRFDFDSEWISVKLKDIAKVTGGKRIPKGYSLINEPNSHPYITVSNMNNNFEDLSTYQYVPTEIYPQIKNYIVDYDDLIISVAGTLGLVKKVPKCLDKANLTENANRISEIQINIDYLQYYLNTTQIQNRILSVQTNNAQPKLALKEIRNFKIQYPSTEEQDKIVNFISNVDKKIFSIDNNLKNMQDFKKGLLQQMFV